MGKEGKMGRSRCAAASALELIGDRWSLLIVRAYIFGDCREYSNFLEIPEGISTNILANRLTWLVEIDILTKHGHPTNRKKFYYDITEKGLDLIPVIMELARWGWTHLPGMWTPPEIKRSFLNDREAFESEWKLSVRATTERYLQSAKSTVQTFPIHLNR
jgi:DNA-binding HxlR family transcriptional regulator